MSNFGDRLARLLAEVQASPAARPELDALLLEARELEREATWLRGLAVATSKLAELGRAAAAQNHQLRQPLMAVQALAARLPEDRQLLIRRIELELAAGGPSNGLPIAQDLGAGPPGDTEAARRLGSSRFPCGPPLLSPARSAAAPTARP